MASVKLVKVRDKPTAGLEENSLYLEGRLSPHKAYRIYIDSNNGHIDTIDVGEIDFLDTDNVGVYFSNTEHASGNFSPDKAFNGTSGVGAFDMWINDSDTGINTDEYIGVILTTPQSASGVTIRASIQGVESQNIRDFTIQYSDDTTDGSDGVWVDILSVTDETGWIALESRSYDGLAYPAQELGTHASTVDGSTLLSLPDKTTVELLATGTSMYEVADITARDALTLVDDAYVQVNDASGDADATTLIATYFYEAINDEYTLVGDHDQKNILILEEW